MPKKSKIKKSASTPVRRFFQSFLLKHDKQIKLILKIVALSLVYSAVKFSQKVHKGREFEKHYHQKFSEVSHHQVKFGLLGSINFHIREKPDITSDCSNVLVHVQVKSNLPNIWFSSPALDHFEQDPTLKVILLDIDAVQDNKVNKEMQYGKITKQVVEILEAKYPDKNIFFTAFTSAKTFGMQLLDQVNSVPDGTARS